MNVNTTINNFVNSETSNKNLKPKQKWVEKYMKLSWDNLNQNEDDEKNIKKKQIQRIASARYRRRLAQELKQKVEELNNEETRNKELNEITKEAKCLIELLRNILERTNNTCGDVYFQHNSRRLIV
jgi:type II secretory ATPase GspE/PulE/Tfp pilus assembly ATPase PilB-like protein